MRVKKNNTQKYFALYLILSLSSLVAINNSSTIFVFYGMYTTSVSINTNTHTHTHTHNSELFSYEKEGNLVIYDNMDGPTGYYAKGGKSDRE